MNDKIGHLLKFLRGRRLVSWTLADQAIVSGASFLTCLFLVRELGLEGFGTFSAAWLVVLVLFPLQDALVTYPMLSIGPKQLPRERPGYFGAVFVHEISFSLAALGSIYALARVGDALFPPLGLREMAFPLAGAACFYLLQNFLRIYFFTINRPVAAVVSDVVSVPGQLLALVLIADVVKLDANLTLTVMGVTSGLAAALGMFWIEAIRWEGSTFAAITARHWHFGKWLAGTAVLQRVTLDWYMLAAGERLGATAIGVLRMSQNLTNVAQTAFAGIDGAITIDAARCYHEGGKPRLIASGRGAFLIVGLLTGPPLILFAVAPGSWLGLLYGSRYVQYGIVLSWFAAAQIFTVYSYLGNTLLRTIESTKAILICYFVAMAFNLVTTPLFLAGPSLQRAAMGTALSRFILMAIAWAAVLARLRELPTALPRRPGKLELVAETCPPVPSDPPAGIGSAEQTTTSRG